jgi:hypothetical protein
VIGDKQPDNITLQQNPAIVSRAKDVMRRVIVMEVSTERTPL